MEVNTAAKWRIKRQYLEVWSWQDASPKWMWGWCAIYPTGLTIICSSWADAIRVVNKELQRRQSITGTNM